MGLFPADFYYYVASYGGLVLIIFLFLNWLTSGFLKVFIKIKASRGKKLLVRVHSRLVVYNVPGWIEGGDLLFFDREARANKQKVAKRLNITDNGAFYRFAGVWCIDIDETTNTILKSDLSNISPFDPIRWNNLLTRALMKPSSEEKDKIIPILSLLAIGIVLLVCIYLAVQVGTIKTIVSQIPRGFVQNVASNIAGSAIP